MKLTPLAAIWFTLIVFAGVAGDCGRFDRIRKV
jgi:hypothetical protein